MKYKHPEYEDQLKATSVLLRGMAREFERLSLECGVEPVVTRVSDPVDCFTDETGQRVCESGVHPAKRAVDFRDEFAGGVFLYLPKQVEWIVRSMNDRYPRMDGKQTCIYHGFGGGPKHFHVQVAADRRVYVLQSDE